MPALTAHILVGNSHQDHGGIIPTHYFFLSENSVPVWVLVTENSFNPENKKIRKVTWLPTVENMLEDALLMIAINVLKDKEISELAKEHFKRDIHGALSLYEDIDPAALKTLYQQCRKLKNRYKIVLTVLEGSSIRSHLKVLKNYEIDMEVCTPLYFRTYSAWTDEVITMGSLDGSQDMRK
jgi:hypothetical protein